MAKVDTAFEVEVISWRIGVCGTMAVEVGAGTGAEAGVRAEAEVAAAAGAGRAGWI